MRLMIGVVTLMVVSVLSIAMLSPAGEDQTGKGGLQASIEQPSTK